MNNSHYGERVIRLYAPCQHEWIAANTAKVVNVEEGPQGEDVITFKCPHCARHHKSVARG